MEAQLLDTFRWHGIQNVWVLDFEFELSSGWEFPTRIVCKVAHNLVTNQILKLGPGQLSACPFHCDASEVFVAFYAIAEASCFIELGWPLPPVWIDLWAEERRLGNGSGLQTGGLLAVLKRTGIPTRDAGHKHYMQALIGEGRWTDNELPAILDYCAEDVVDTVTLLERRLPLLLEQTNAPDRYIALGQVFVRGRFMAENARMARIGLPVDGGAWRAVADNFDKVKLLLIDEVDEVHGYHVYEEGRFSAQRFADYLTTNNIPWPRLASGALDLKDDTFRDMAGSYPQLHPLHALRSALSEFRRNKVLVTDEDRSYVNMRPFSSKTGRSQPSNSKFLFGLSRWARSFLLAREGYTIGYLDYASQEIAIAAALSKDLKLLAAYISGDPYLQFARDAGLAPASATKDSHADIRSRCKQVVLGVQYGMQAESLATRAGVTVLEARNLLQLHRESYPVFWRWVEAKRSLAALGAVLYTPMGWRIRLGHQVPLNERSNGNWTIQSTGSDILRVATILCTDACIPAICTVHDALVFEVPIDQADELLARAQCEMVRAAKAVIGCEVRVDITRHDHPHVYRDERGFDFYQKVVKLSQQRGLAT